MFEMFMKCCSLVQQHLNNQLTIIEVLKQILDKINEISKQNKGGKL